MKQTLHEYKFFGQIKTKQLLEKDNFNDLSNFNLDIKSTLLFQAYVYNNYAYEY